MKVFSIIALAIAGLLVASCGSSRNAYDHDVVYRSPAYGERYYYDYDDDVDYYYDDDDDGAYYRVVPAPDYDDDVPYYYRD